MKTRLFLSNHFKIAGALTIAVLLGCSESSDKSVIDSSQGIDTVKQESVDETPQQPSIQSGPPASPWDGKTFSAENGQFSPYDSLVTKLNFNWTGSNAEAKASFIDQLASLYPKKFEMMHQIATDGTSTKRYIINDPAVGLVVLERIQYAGCVIFYIKNGVPEHEMKFYKLLTAYYAE